MSPSVWMFLFLYLSGSKALEQIKVKTGDDVILQCRDSGEAAVELLEWIKPDLKTEEYVFFFRENQAYEDYQHPSFFGRVQLKDPEMKGGDFSVILKNVNSEDTGKYECRVGKSNSGLSKRSTPELLNSITLKVHDSVGINMVADTGDTVVLPNKVPSKAPIKSVYWVRRDLERAGYVFLSQNGKSVPQNQHPYFKNYVELRHSDLSLILKEAMNVDSGIYECWVTQEGTNRRTSTVKLYVNPGYKEDGGGPA